MLSSQIVLENYGDKAEIESTCAAYCHLAALVRMPAPDAVEKLY